MWVLFENGEGDDRLRFLFWIDGVRLEGKWINGRCNRKIRNRIAF